MTKKVRTKAFTLVELIVALVVTAIIMSAIATLAFALNSVNDATDDTDRTQAHVRYATLKISELIRHCKLICSLTNGDLVIWRDDNVLGGEGEINVGELVYIETGNNHIQLLDFPQSPSWMQTYHIPLSSLRDSMYKTTLKDLCDENYVLAIPECSNVQFQFDESPPHTTFVNISFGLTENGLVRQYHIDSALRCWAGHLLNAAGSGLVSDDD